MNEIVQRAFVQVIYPEIEKNIIEVKKEHTEKCEDCKNSNYLKACDLKFDLKANVSAFIISISFETLLDLVTEKMIELIQIDPPSPEIILHALTKNANDTDMHIPLDSIVSDVRILLNLRNII